MIQVENIEVVMVYKVLTIIFSIFMSGCQSSEEGENNNLSSQVYVPKDFPTIQEAIDNSRADYTINISCGVYEESLIINDKSLTISRAKDQENCDVIVNSNGRVGLSLLSSNGSVIDGISFINADDGISTDSNVTIKNNKFISNVDGIDFESGGGQVINNKFYNSKDDAIDLDYDVNVIIEDNFIYGSQDDGIEIRLQQDVMSGEKKVIIRNNIIQMNQSDGIQIIDYEMLTNRMFEIYNNSIIQNSAGISYNDNEKTTVSNLAGSIEEDVNIYGNVFINNVYSYRLDGDNTIIDSSYCITEKDSVSVSNLEVNFFCYD